MLSDEDDFRSIVGGAVGSCMALGGEEESAAGAQFASAMWEALGK